MTQLKPVRFLDRTAPPHIMTLVLLAGLSAAAMNIYLPSLPHMATYFDSDYATMQLSVSLYLAVNAVLQLFIGSLSDRFGRRPVVLASFALFCLSTLGILIAPTVGIFLLFRMGQAVVVAGLVLSRAIVRDMVPQEEAASKIAYVTMGMAIVPMFAPVVGGALDQAFGWQANFWLLFLLGLAVLALAWADVGETATESGQSLSKQLADVPQLLASPRFWGYSLAAMFASGAFFAYLGGAPFVGAEIYHLGPAELGLFFGSPALGYLVGNAISGMYSVRYGINMMVFWGALICSCGLLVSLVLALGGLGTVWTFFGFMVFVGFGNGMVLPNATAGLLSVRPKLSGTASGLGGAMMIGGGAALSALAGALLVPGATELPLLLVMTVSSVLAIVSVVLVIARERQLARRTMG